MTVVVTRNVPPRTRGFLASCLLEIAPGVYVSPKMNKGVRERVWNVCVEWFDDSADESIVMTWSDRDKPGGQGILTLGLPKKELCDNGGVMMVRRALRNDDHQKLQTT